MKNEKYSFLVLITAAGFAMLAADFLILLFFKNTFSQLRFRLGIPALIFLTLYCFILGRGAILALAQKNRGRADKKNYA